MRKKIITSIDNLNEASIYDVIQEKGEFKKVTLSSDDINDLLDYFTYINKNNDLAIDIYEEEIICDINKIIKVLNDTKKFKTTIISSLNTLNLLNKIENILAFSIENKSCIYFIL